MRGVSRWHAGAVAGAGLAAALTLGAAHWGAGRYERDFALRTAATTAAYLGLVAPPGPRGSDYDLQQLLIQARALEALPGWTPAVEVYHGTAPLVHATAPPLTPAELDRLRRRSAATWTERGGRALAPLLDRDDWDVVGAVAVRPRDLAPGWLDGWALPALLAALAAALACVRALGREPEALRRPLQAYAAAALLLGSAAYANVRGAARESTDRWLSDTRLLMQEASARLPGGRPTVADLGRLARGAEVVPGDSGTARPARREVDGAPRAVVEVRLSSHRWTELRVLPAEAVTEGWLALTLGLALLGPLGAWLAAWARRAAARPQRLRETVAAWGFLTPAALHLAVFSFAPIAFALYLSVHRWSLVEPVKPFVGLENFTRLVRDPLVWVSLRNTALYALSVPVTMAVALALALVLSRRSRGVRLVRTAFFLPYVSSVVAIALVWQWMYHADFGLVNYALSLLGLGPVDWLGDPKTALLAVMVVAIWVQLGYQMTIFLAGLQGIPDVYLDAARVDGANAWQRFWRVTFPLLTPVTLFVLVTGVIASFQVFTYVYVLTDGGPLHATDVIVYRIYQTAWEFLQFGYASALSLLVFLVLFGVTWAQFRLLGRRVEYA